MVGSPGNKLPSLGAFRSHLLNINSNQKRFVMNIKTTLSLLGNFKGFRDSVPETETETKIYNFLLQIIISQATYKDACYIKMSGHFI